MEVAGEPQVPQGLLCLLVAACLSLMQQPGSGYIRAAAGAALGVAGVWREGSA